MKIKKSEILNQVERILATPVFYRSKIVAKFLQFIVEETLAGNEVHLKEYTIGTSVLDKAPDFNPQVDGVVRVHAGRLRKLLNEYYTGPGVNDTIVISIPKGRYVPIFEKLEINKSNQSEHLLDRFDVPVKSKLALLPFNFFEESEPQLAVCTELHKQLFADLSWFPEIDVLSEYAHSLLANGDEGLIQALLNENVDYCIVGNCKPETDTLHFIIELQSVPFSSVPIWTQPFVLPKGDFSETDIQPIVQKVISLLCGVLGIIYRNKQNVQLVQDYDNLRAIFWHNHYHTDYSEVAIMQTLHALDVGLKKNPNNSLLMAFMAELYLNFNLMDLQQGVNFLDKVLELAKRAVHLDAGNQHAYGILAAASLHGKNKADYEFYSQKCMAVNPASPLYKGMIGFFAILAGDYQKGAEQMAQSIQQSAYYPFEINVGYCLVSLHKEKYEEALIWANRIKRNNLIWDPILRIVCLAYLNSLEEAQEAKAHVLTLSPNFPERAKIIVNIPLLDTAMQGIILNGLQLAGLVSTH